MNLNYYKERIKNALITENKSDIGKAISQAEKDSDIKVSEFCDIVRYAVEENNKFRKGNN